MSESMRVPSLVVSMLAVGVMMADICFARLQPPAHSPRPEEKRAETAAKQKDEDEANAWRERYLCLELESVLERCQTGKKPSVLDECESLLRRTLALPKPGARTLSLCAIAANALDRPRQAIEILKNAIAEYPEEDAGGTIIMPLRISGRFRIAAIATRIGDVSEAIQAYEAILEDPGEAQNRRINEFLCHMYLADLFRGMAGKEQTAIEQLRDAVRVAASFGEDGSRGDTIANARLLQGWAAYELAKLCPDEPPGEPGPDPNALPSLSSCWMLAIVLAITSCPSMPEIELMAGSERPSTLRVLARFGLARNYIEDSNLNPPKAEKYLLNVIGEDSYFKPYANATLPFVYEDMKEIREEIPALLNDLRHGDFEQREHAASRLCRSTGPEGIEALQQAQQDPNEYVRYEAACALAQWGRDSAIQANFRTILDAVMEEDPRIHDEALSAVRAGGSCLEIGPKEIIALIGLMDEHYSTELTWTLDDVLFSAKLEAQEAAVTELACLVKDERQEVREGAIEIYSRIGGSLRLRLEFEEQAMQVRIIELLGRLGPVGGEVRDTLATYAEHENPNIRNAAAEALKNLQSSESGQTPEEAQDP